MNTACHAQPLRKAANAILAGIAINISVGLIGASTAQATCSGKICVQVELINNPAYVHFRVTIENAPGWAGKFNVRQGNRQQEVKSGQLTYVPRGDASTLVAVQACGSLTFILQPHSKCTPWQNFTLPGRGAPPPQECDTYATNTVVQAHAGKTCGFSGARWDTNKQFHFDWCINLRGGDVSLPASETAARDQALKDCQEFCDTYATRAVEQAQESLNQKCGFTGLRWDLSHSMHLNWCKSLNGDRNLPNSERTERDKGLKYCLEKAASQSPPPPEPAADQATGTESDMGTGVDQATGTESDMGTGMDQATGTESDMGTGMDPAAETGSVRCPAGAVATVVIPEPQLHKLNVRQSPGGKVITTVPEGSEVTVVGECGSEAAAGIARQMGGVSWCQIDSPVSGCVLAKYLSFGGDAGGAGDEQAAGFKKRSKH